jgi:elongation factor Ts
MSISIEEIKRLRELTGVGMTDAKKALTESKGDFDKALEAMRVKGLAKADKKSEREAKEGLIGEYVHSGRIGVLVEVNSETDFVARTDDFKTFVHDIAMHIAASNPQFVAIDDVDKKTLDKEKDLIKKELKESGKPDKMIDQISEGKIKKYYTEVCLLEQPYIKNPDQTVDDYLKEIIAKLGENIVIRRFSRLELGEVE